MKIKVTTSTGSYYRIDTEGGPWSKNDTLEYNSMTELRSGLRTDGTTVAEWRTVKIPVVGESMFICGEHMYDWWITTPIVSVEPDDE